MTKTTPNSQRWFALALLCVAQFMVVLDFSIINVALPAMQRDLGLLMSAAVASMIFILTLYMQEVLGYSALQIGLAFLPHAIVAIVAAPLASRLVTGIGVKSTLASGMILSVVGLLLLTQISVQGSFVRDLLPGTVIVGFGIVIALVTVTIAATAGVNDSEQGLASGLLNTSQQIGSAVGLAILVAASTARTNAIVASIGNSPVALKTATTAGFQAALAVGAGFAAAGLFVALLVIRESDCRQTKTRVSI